MKIISVIALVFFTLVCAGFAHVFCFTENAHFIGGYIPFVILTVSPFAGYLAGSIINS
jgi:hypothetical protein